MIDNTGHCQRGAEVEFVDGNESADPACRRESCVGEYALQASGLLQNQRQIIVRRHNDPTKADGIHVTGFIETCDRMIETVTLEIGGVIQKPDIRFSRPKTIEVPL